MPAKKAYEFHPIRHFMTITEHKLLVMHYCFRVGLYRQGLLHDLSKYHPVEFLVGARYYQGNRSPNNAEREDIGVSTSWLHHKGRNLHHFEHWVDYAPGDPRTIMGAKMPRRYIVEMLMDRISASRVYNREKYTDQQPLEYWLRNKEKLWFVHPETARQLEGLLRMLSRHGEEKTFRFIREVYLKKGRISRKKRSGPVRSRDTAGVPSGKRGQRAAGPASDRTERRYTSYT